MFVYRMMGMVGSRIIYIPQGIIAKPEDPLLFIGIASQKNFHRGSIIWEFMQYRPNTSGLLLRMQKHRGKKLDMGKSCLRYKKAEDIPYDLIGELASKITPDEWIAVYEKNIKR